MYSAKLKLATNAAEEATILQSPILALLSPSAETALYQQAKNATTEIQMTTMDALTIV